MGRRVRGPGVLARRGPSPSSRSSMERPTFQLTIGTAPIDRSRGLPSTNGPAPFHLTNERIRHRAVDQSVRRLERPAFQRPPLRLPSGGLRRRLRSWGHAGALDLIDVRAGRHVHARDPTAAGTQAAGPPRPPVAALLGRPCSIRRPSVRGGLPKRRSDAGWPVGVPNDVRSGVGTRSRLAPSSNGAMRFQHLSGSRREAGPGAPLRSRLCSRPSCSMGAPVSAPVSHRPTPIHPLP